MMGQGVLCPEVTGCIPGWEDNQSEVALVPSHEAWGKRPYLAALTVAVF